MDRRGFLKMLSAVACSAALRVPKFVLVDPMVVMPSMPIELGTIRMLASYMIEFNETIVRLDACNGVTHSQFGVDFRVPTEWEHCWRERCLKPAEMCLKNEIEHHGWMASDMVALPTPRDYVEPTWMRQ